MVVTWGSWACGADQQDSADKSDSDGEEQPDLSATDQAAEQARAQVRRREQEEQQAMDRMDVEEQERAAQERQKQDAAAEQAAAEEATNLPTFQDLKGRKVSVPGEVFGEEFAGESFEGFIYKNGTHSARIPCHRHTVWVKLDATMEGRSGRAKNWVYWFPIPDIVKFLK